MNPFRKFVSRFSHTGFGWFCLTAASVATPFHSFAQGSLDPDDPAAELASFRVADGFEVNLFASETNGVVKPIQIRFDPGGRIWVIGSTVYPQIQPGQRPDDKVLILEDSDRDGRVDHVTVFADGLMIPTGLEVTGKGCYVGQGTELLLLNDNDGDGRADERTVVLRGFGTGDNHQNINSFLWGDGGELFMCQGLHIRSHVETPWGISSLEQAGLWRLRPRLLKLDGFFGSANEPQNPWGWVFTEWGEPIVIPGNNSSFIYPVPGMITPHRDLPPPLIWKKGNGRKCSNGDMVGTSHFPDSWQGKLIVGGYINNAVWVLQIKEDGAGFALEDAPPLITSTNRNFRPVDAKFGPDGALYIADWYNPIIGHYQASFRHPDRDKTHGRIWRVTAKNRPLTPNPALLHASLDHLLKSLESPDRWTRHFAKRVLADRPLAMVTNALALWIRQSPRSDLALKEALGVFQSHEVVEESLLRRLAQAHDPGARAYAAAVTGAWADRFPRGLELLESLIADSNARVRLQAIVACSYFTNSHALEIAARVADQPSDKFIDYALQQAVFALKPFWLPALQGGTLNLDNKPSRLSMVARFDGTPDTAAALRSLLLSPKTSSAAQETFWKILADVGDANDLLAMLQLKDHALLARLFPSITESVRLRDGPPSGNLSGILQPLLEHGDPRLKSGALRLAGNWKVKNLRDAPERIAQDRGENVETRRAAIDSLAAFADDPARLHLAALAENEPDPPVRAAAIAGLAGLNLPSASQHAAKFLSTSIPQSAVDEIISAFLQRRGGPEALAAALSGKALPPANVESALQKMNSSGRKNELLLRALAGSNPFKSPNIDPSSLPVLIEEVRRAGNANAGAEIFRRPALGCVSCHSVEGQGGNIGPNLSTLGSAQPIDFIIGAILDPQKEIKEGFTAYRVTTKSGDEFQGYILRESTSELLINDVLLQREVRVPKNRIEDRRLIGSLMPGGLADGLTRIEFRDLIKYLSGLGRN